MRAPFEKRRPAVVVPFPYIRRRVFIERQASRAAALNPDAADRHVRYQVQVQVDAMRRRGIDEQLILREARCLENAIRAALCGTFGNAPGGRR